MDMKIGRAYCVQLSVDAVRWRDAQFRGILLNGEQGDPEAIREALRRLARDGYEVAPCPHADDAPPGYCKGFERAATPIPEPEDGP